MENLEANLVEALSKGLKKAEENGALVLTTTVISDITNVHFLILHLNNP